MPQNRSCRRVLVSGSSGFIGSHLCAHLVANGVVVVGVDRSDPSFPGRHQHITLDLTARDAPVRLASLGKFDAAIHLAALANVIVPRAECAELWQTNVVGTLNLLNSVDTSLVLFASSCAVYGNAATKNGAAKVDRTEPIGVYGMSKAAGEMVCNEWVHSTRRSVLVFRFGNVIGARCRGLVPYLVNHATTAQGGSPPAQLRGQGRIVRDYVPVEYIVRILGDAATGWWSRATWLVLNLGTGRGQTNGRIARDIQALLAERGHALTLRFDAPIALGEARRAVVDTSRTREFFDIPIPTAADVRAALTRAVDDALSSCSGRIAKKTAATGW